jgi:hypothetical protein
MISESGEQQISSLRRRRMRPFATSFIHVKTWGTKGG